MPRIAIKDFNTSFFHVIVQGIRKEFIFNTHKDKKNYLSYMYKYLEKYNIKIISYCIMDNHAHMLIFTEKINVLSEYMRCINTSYALYYNKTYQTSGYVFRNRYKAEPIYNSRYLINCIHYIHDNPVKAKICNSVKEYHYSSYYEYFYNKGTIIKTCKKRFPEINSLFIDKIFDDEKIDYDFMDYEVFKQLKNKSIVLNSFLDENNISKSDVSNNEKYLSEISKKLYYESGLSQQDIANEFNVNRMKISRLLNKNKEVEV